MNAHELNKYIGALLAALVFAMGLSVLSDIIFHPKELYDPAYVIAIAKEEGDLKDAEAAETPFATLMAAADPASGKNVTRVCGACHTFEEGGANGIGPNLHGVVGHPVASHAGFNYSAGMKSFSEGKTWTYEELNAFIEAPQAHVPGTIMGFAGIKDPAQRADAIAYLRSESPDAPPLPEPPAETAAVDSGETATDAAPEGAAEGAAVPATEEAAPAPGATVEEQPANAEEAAAEDQGLAQIVANADPATGQAAAAICLACHSVNEGEAAKIGPNLHGVYGRPIASVDGFAYSDAMKNFAQKDGEWTLQHLDTYLTAPMEVVPGTHMAFAGVKDDAQRAAIIAWLHSISPDAAAILAPTSTTAGEAPAAPAATTEGAAPAAPAASEGEKTEAPAEAAPAATEEQSGAAEPAAPAEQDTAAAEAPASVDAQNVTIEPARKSQVEVVNPQPAAN